MNFVFYLQFCFVLVSSIPLYEFDCCPNTYPNNRNDQPLVVQRSNYNTYPLNVLGHNIFNSLSNSQSVPHQCQHLNTNNFVPNYQFYNQNGLDIIQHIPETETQKVINNYILIPQEYFQNDAIENKSDKKIREEVSKKNLIKSSKKNKNKIRRPNMSANINNANDDIGNPEAKTTKPERRKETTDNSKSGRKKSKKKSKKNNSNLLTVEKTLPLKKVSDDGEALIKHSNNHLTSSCGKNDVEKKLNYQESKTTKGSTKKDLINEHIPDIKLKKKDDTGFADVNVCFDINEDCTDLDCRHTRNKDVNRRHKPQSSKPQQEIPNNLNNYMNGIPYNQQMSPNFFNPNVNFPFNFDYLYQMPQTSTVKPKEPNNKRRNRKRKQPSSNRQTNTNKKNKISIATVNNCDTVVELTPEIPRVETTTEAIKTTTNTEESQSLNIVQEEITLEKDPDSNLENPISTCTETLLTEVLNSDEISKNNKVPFDIYNDVMDEYYPDFTLDNTYISSKEDYEFGNFHDRYYYAYGDKPELNRDRRKYEHPNDNNLNGYRKLNRNNQNKNIIQEPSQIQEIICKTDTSTEKVPFVTPPALEFPGFKTEKINKEKLFAQEDYHHSNNNDISANRICPSSKPIKGKENQRTNNVETVFANSRVVRYGAQEKEEIITKDPEPEIKQEFRNLISHDGKTTIVIAKSLDYSY